MRKIVGAIGLVLVLSPATSSAQVYVSLEQGQEWNYTDGMGTTMQWVVSGTQVVQGVTTVRLVETFSDGEIVEDYLTSTPAGDLFLHGARFVKSGVEYSFDPPLQLLDVPLEVGKTWSDLLQRYSDLEGKVPQGEPVEQGYQVQTFAPELQVPAGTFEAYGLGLYPLPAPGVLEAPDAPAKWLLGGLVGQARGTAFLWYSAGVGIVMSNDLQLVSYTPVEESSWSQIKAAYRSDD